MGEKQEILERVLLLMKYDNKKTLSENRGVIVEQQIGYDSYLEKKSKSELGTTKEWEPKLKEYDGFFGKLQLPETATVKYFPEGINLLKSGTDNKGDFFYWEKASAKYGLPNDYEFKDGSGNNIKLNAKSKFYLPTKWLNENFNDKVSRFTIPKDTIIPKFTKTEWFDGELDKWVESPLEQDNSFRIIIQIPTDNFYRSLNPFPNDAQRGFEISRGYFRLDENQGGYVSYNPKEYIQFNSPNYVWWLNYGLIVEIVASIIITILSEGVLGETLFITLAERGLITAARKGTLKFTLDALLNGILNLGIANYHFSNNNDSAGRLSIICCFVPLLVKFNSKIASLFKRSVPELQTICNEIMESIQKNITKLASDDPKVWAKWSKTLSKNAQEVLNNISKLEKSEIEDGLKLMVETVAEKVTTSKIETKTVLNSILKKGAGFSKVVGRFLGDTIVIGGEIMGIYKAVEKILGPTTTEEKAAIVIYMSELTDVSSSDEVPKLTPEKAQEMYLSMSEEERKNFIDSLPPKLVADTITAIYNRMNEVTPHDIEDACPSEILMDTTYWNPNTDFIGSDEVFKKYPACRSYVKP